MNKYIFYFIIPSLVLFGCRSTILDDPGTHIQYSIPQPSHVKLTVENSYDTVIATLVDEDMPAGAFNVNFSMSNLPEGIYFYVLEYRGINNDYYYKSTKQLLLIK